MNIMKKFFAISLTLLLCTVFAETANAQQKDCCKEKCKAEQVQDCPKAVQCEKKCDKIEKKCDKIEKKCDKAAKKCDKSDKKCDKAAKKCDKAEKKCCCNPCECKDCKAKCEGKVKCNKITDKRKDKAKGHCDKAKGHCNKIKKDNKKD